MANNQPARTKKRRVKNPETFRERAVKAAEDAQQPKAHKRVTGKFSKAIAKVWGPIGKPLRGLSSLKLFRVIGKVFKIIGRIILPSYVRKSWQELKLVAWPNWKQSRRLTYAVLIFAIVFGVAIAGVDYGLDKIFRNVLLK